MNLIICILLWTVYSLLEGVREAYYYNLPTSSQQPNLHSLFAAQRLQVLVLIGIYLQSVWPPICFALIFPAIHDGIYYYQRNKLNPSIYPKKWFDSSTTSTAILEFNLTWRIVLLVIGVVGLIWYKINICTFVD